MLPFVIFLKLLISFLSPGVYSREITYGVSELTWLEDQENHALLWDDSPLFFSLQFRVS